MTRRCFLLVRLRGTARTRGRAGAGAATASAANQSTAAIYSAFTAARSRAEAARGFAATSASLGRTGRRWIARSSGS